MKKTTSSISEIIEEIKKKKELSGLADELINDSIIEYIRKNKINLTSLSTYDKKLLIKAPFLGPGFDLLVKYYDLNGLNATLILEDTVNYGQQATFSLKDHQVAYIIDGTTTSLIKKIDK